MGFASAKRYPVAKYLNNSNKKSFSEKAREKKLRFWLKKLTGVAEAWSRLLLTKKKNKLKVWKRKWKEMKRFDIIDRIQYSLLV